MRDILPAGNIPKMEGHAQSWPGDEEKMDAISHAGRPPKRVIQKWRAIRHPPDRVRI